MPSSWAGPARWSAYDVPMPPGEEPDGRTPAQGPDRWGSDGHAQWSPESCDQLPQQLEVLPGEAVMVATHGNLGQPAEHG